MGIVVLTVLIGAALILAACTHTYPESPTVEFDYDHCIIHTTEEAVACEVKINPPRAEK
jgi:outer membrane biogenesis lipoprotein LolB